MVKRSFLNMMNRIYRSEEKNFENEIQIAFEKLTIFFNLKSMSIFQYAQDESFMRRIYSFDILKGFENNTE
jgi:hypothetical protein